MASLIFFVLKALSRLLNFFPQAFVLFMGDCLGWLWYNFLPIRKDTVLKNLSDCFGDRLSENEIQRLALQNYRHYGRAFFEILQSVSWSGEQMRKTVPVEGLQNIQEALSMGKGAFLLTCHLGNWEVSAGSIAMAGIPFDIVVKFSRTRFVERFLQNYRKKMGLGLFLEQGTAKDILRSLSAGRAVGFMLDQFMGPPIGLPVNFFGRKAGTAAGLALLTEKNQVPVLPAYSFRDQDGRIRTRIEPVLQYPKLSDAKDVRLYEKTQFFNDVIERIIRYYPDQWLWLHRRWKPYRGTPKWLPVKALLFLSVLLQGCASKTASTPTGIALPPDKEIVVPRFEEVKDDIDDEAEETVSKIGDEIIKVERGTGKDLEGGKAQPPINWADPVKKRNRRVERPPTAIPPAAQEVKPFKVLAADKIPFELGERLEVELFWNVVPVVAGKATLEVREGPKIGSRPTLELWGNVLSSKVVDYIYHIDNTIESYVDATGLIPYRFFLHMLETHQKKETKVEFNHPDGKANYWAKRISKKWKDDFQDRIDPISPGARDMFSALFFSRTINYTMNKKEAFSVYENGKNWDVELNPVANELVITKAGAFQCWKILVTVQINNILKPLGETYLWLSEDSKKYIVKFSSKIKVGSVLGNLVSIRERM